MKKGTKKIRRVCTGKNEYYVYDLDPTINGIRKRLYAKTQLELEEKIRQAQSTQSTENKFFAPQKSEPFSAFFKFYLRCCVGKRNPSTMRQELELVNTIVLDSQIDIPLEELTEDIVNSFLVKTSNLYSVESLIKLKDIILNTFENANAYGVNVSLNAEKIIIPDISGTRMSYIISPEQYERLEEKTANTLSSSYGNNLNVVLFHLYTGVMPRYILNIKERDLDLNRNVVFINYMEERVQIEINDRTKEFLKNYLYEKNLRRSEINKDEELFRYNGRLPNLSNLNATLGRIIKKMGLQNGTTFKSLQRAYIMKELENGTPAKILSKNLNVPNYKIEQIIESKYLQNELL